MESLSEWDRRLLRRYLDFYRSLDSGMRVPSTVAQEHFVAFCRGQAKPRTQHEIAYSRYLATSPSVDRKRQRSQPLESKQAPTPTPKNIAIVDAIEEVEYASETSSELSSLFDRLKSLYREGTAKARRAASDAALWTSTILSDPQFARSIEQWMGDNFNSVSNAYTRAMDGAYAVGLQAGKDYVSPSLHRLFSGHTPQEAWDAVHNALPNDTAAQEFLGLLQALGSDMSSVMGLPVMTMTKDGYEAIRSAVTSLGIPEDWLRDLLHYNALEVVNGCLPLLAALLNWSSAEAETFRNLVGSLSVSAIVAANPIMAVIAVVMLARSYHFAQHQNDQRDWARALAEGGLRSGLVLAASALIGGPAWVGLVSGICIAAALRQARGSAVTTELADFLRRRLSNLKRRNNETSWDGVGLR